MDLKLCGMHSFQAMYFYVDNFNELNATVVTLIKIITYNSVALKLESNTATNIEQHCRNFKLRQCCTEIPRQKMDCWVGKLS